MAVARLKASDEMRGLDLNQRQHSSGPYHLRMGPIL